MIYAVAMAGLLSDVRRISGCTVERDAAETRVVYDGHVMARCPSTDDALADVRRAVESMALVVLVCCADVDGRAGEA